MKKLFLTIGILFIGLTVSSQESLRAGAFLGFPIGNASNTSSFTMGFEGNYLFEVSEKFEAGFGLAFSYNPGKNGAGGASYLPFFGAARFNINDDFFVGTDLGYAVAVNSGVKGGFYYRPMFGYNINEKFLVSISLGGIARSGGSANSLLFGGMYKFDL